MQKRYPARPTPAAAQDRRAQVLARIEAALQSTGSLELAQDRGGLDPYTTLNGPIRRDVWGARAR